MCCDHFLVSGNSVIPGRKMAEEFEVVASSSKKKLKRGSYNQYLSEPGAKIPRTTLKRWPKKTLQTTSISPSADNSKDDLDITSSKYSNATCVISSSIVTETAPAELAYRSLHQTELWPENASSILHLDEYAVDYDDNKLSFETQSDESNLPEGDFEEISKPTESEQATIELTISSEGEGDQQYGEREYLDALISEECANDQNRDPKEKTFADVPLYDGAPISVAVSMLLIVTFAIRHSLTGLAIVDLLTLVSLHCALPNQCASSIALLKKFFMRLKNPIEFHYYCTFCMQYQGLSLAEDKLCRNRCCLKDLNKKENSSYFIIIPLMCQLRDLVQSKYYFCEPQMVKCFKCFSRHH